MRRERERPPARCSSKQRRPECSAVMGRERKISSCISDEVGRGKRKKEVTAGERFAAGDTVPSFPVVCFLSTRGTFFFSFSRACVQNWVSHILSKYIFQKSEIHDVAKCKRGDAVAEKLKLCGANSWLRRDGFPHRSSYFCTSSFSNRTAVEASAS